LLYSLCGYDGPVSLKQEKLQNCKTAKLQNRKTAKLQNRKTAKQA